MPAAKKKTPAKKAAATKAKAAEKVEYVVFGDESDYIIGGQTYRNMEDARRAAKDYVDDTYGDYGSNNIMIAQVVAVLTPKVTMEEKVIQVKKVTL